MIYFLTHFWLLVFFNSSQANSKWKYDIDTQVTRCFLAKNVTFNCVSSEESDSEKSSELEILAKSWDGTSITFGYGKMLPAQLCREHLTKVLSIVRGEKQLCITGDGENKMTDKTIFSRWVGLSTSKGEVLR